TVLSFLVTGSLAIRERFDVVHGQGMCTWFNDVVTVHQLSRAWYLARRRLGDHLHWREHVFGSVVSFLEHAFYRLFRRGTAIAVSDRVGQDLRKLYGCGVLIRTIYHGTDLSTFSPDLRHKYRQQVRNALNLRDDELMFLFVGDLRKGARQCIQALAGL